MQLLGFLLCSLRVNLDMGKSAYGWMIMKDENIPGTVVRTSTIPEELGRIVYLLTDKTGELLLTVVMILLHPFHWWDVLQPIRREKPPSPSYRSHVNDLTQYDNEPSLFHCKHQQLKNKTIQVITSSFLVCQLTSPCLRVELQHARSEQTRLLSSVYPA